MKLSRENFRKFKEGIKNLSPVAQLHSKLVGHIGNVFGILFAFAYLIWKHMWWFSIILVFSAFLEIINVIGTRQQWKAALDMENMIKQAEQTQQQEEVK